MTDTVSQQIELRINREEVSAAVEPRTSLADFLREQQMLCGTNTFGQPDVDAAGECAAQSRQHVLENPVVARVINDPATLAAVEAAFDAYETALTTNDVAMLDTLFWNSPHTLRYGATENLHGYEEIREFRAQRPGKGLMRTIMSRSITVFGTDFAVANIVFTRDGEPRLGRQSQSWVRIDGARRVVAAHVSWRDA
jgi:hypothetical protein